MKMRKRLSVAAAVLMAFGPTAIPSLAHAGDQDGAHRHHGPRTVREEARFVANSVVAVALEYQDGTPTDSAILSDSHARGRWGRSTTRSLTRLDLGGGVYSNCFDGEFGILFQYTQFDFQTTYSDLSSIHGTIAGGELCANVTDKPDQRTYWLEGNVVGGTGRFAGATVTVHLEGRLTQLEPGRWSVAEGTASTTLTLP